jgi:hypothetical protein
MEEVYTIFKGFLDPIFIVFILLLMLLWFIIKPARSILFVPAKDLVEHQKRK